MLVWAPHLRRDRARPAASEKARRPRSIKTISPHIGSWPRGKTPSASWRGEANDLSIADPISAGTGTRAWQRSPGIGDPEVATPAASVLAGAGLWSRGRRRSLRGVQESSSGPAIATTANGDASLDMLLTADVVDFPNRGGGLATGEKCSVGPPSVAIVAERTIERAGHFETAVLTDLRASSRDGG